MSRATTVRAAHPTTSEALGALAAEGATGALTGERGTVYLAGGRVVHAESACTPDLATLLTRDGAAGASGRRAAAGTGHARPAAGALEVCHLGALFDAAYFVLAHDSRAHRFRPGVLPRLGAVRSVPVDTVVRESRRRRDLLERIWPDPAIDTAPLARVPGAGTDDLPARRGRTLTQVDGVRTAAEIAASLACRTYHTLVELRRLAADGLVTAAAAPAPPAGAEPRPYPAVWDDPDTALLRRLKDALEAL